ncbi:MAG: GNAT family N-acetyltransferase [Clostridia bacterium]|nr:GNAT family N-acetyltransferase [Clostridia bacterium]
MERIRTERLVLRPVEIEDWRAIKEIWDDFRVSPYAQYDKPHPTEPAEVRARAARWVENQSDEHMFFAVCLEGRMIGYIACHDRGGGAYECGYCFHSAFHSRGYAGEAMRAVAGLLRDRGVKNLTAGTALGNAPSVRLLQSLGFELVETEKVSFYKDEKGNDIVFEGGVFSLPLQR